MPCRAAVLLATVVLCAVPNVARADGSIPPNPYHYVHPPAALVSENKPPLSLTRTLAASYVRSVVTFSAFTGDGQAGISGGRGALAVPASARSVRFTLTPLLPASGLPPSMVADGNAYRITATAQPGGTPLSVKLPILLTLRYPHVPVAIYIRRGHTWRQLCYEDSSILTNTTFACKTRTLGTFVLATPPFNAKVSAPPSTPVHQLNRYIPALAALILVILAAIAGWYVTRPDARKQGDRGR